MKKRVLIALMLSLASGNLLAQTSSTGSESGANAGSEDTAPTPKRTAHPAAAAEARKGSQRADTQRANNPRWHSFLPGMFR